MKTSEYRGRIAPTPSGLLHLGHALTFKTAWERARVRGGKIVLRIEDIDLERCKKEYASAAVSDLRSIGLDWDEGPDIGGKFAPYTQSERFGYYWSIVEKLSELGFVYPSETSRAQIKSLGRQPARKFDFTEPETLFPISLRTPCAKTSEIDGAKFRNWRFAVPEGRRITFLDNNKGEMSFFTQEDFGDFPVWRKCAEPSYELAVVADDNAMEITEAVRGEDLLLSTARQILLYESLGFKIPEFYHCPILRGEDGKKISKSSMKKSSENKWLIRANADRKI